MAGASDAKEAIAQASSLFERQYCAGDARALVTGYFADDVLNPAAYPPGSAPVRGRAALIGMFSGMIGEVPTIRLETLDVVASDTVAFEVGRAHLVTKDGAKATGRYTVCWIHTDAGWRAKTDFFAEDGWSD